MDFCWLSSDNCCWKAVEVFRQCSSIPAKHISMIHFNFCTVISIQAILWKQNVPTVEACIRLWRMAKFIWFDKFRIRMAHRLVWFSLFGVLVTTIFWRSKLKDTIPIFSLVSSFHFFHVKLLIGIWSTYYAYVLYFQHLTLSIRNTISNTNSTEVWFFSVTYTLFWTHTQLDWG